MITLSAQSVLICNQKIGLNVIYSVCYMSKLCIRNADFTCVVIIIYLIGLWVMFDHFNRWGLEPQTSTTVIFWVMIWGNWTITILSGHLSVLHNNFWFYLFIYLWLIEMWSEFMEARSNAGKQIKSYFYIQFLTSAFQHKSSHLRCILKLTKKKETALSNNDMFSMHNVFNGCNQVCQVQSQIALELTFIWIQVREKTCEEAISCFIGT